MGRGIENIGIGYASMLGENYNYELDSLLSYKNSGSYNVAIGRHTFNEITTASYNTAVGHLAGVELETGNSNVSIGYWSGQGHRGYKDAHLGHPAIGPMTGNIAVGSFAGWYHDGGNFNVFIGYGVSPNDTASFKLAIGMNQISNSPDSAWAANYKDRATIYADMAKKHMKINVDSLQTGTLNFKTFTQTNPPTTTQVHDGFVCFWIDDDGNLWLCRNHQGIIKMVKLEEQTK
jgi:hypothetical protein